MLGFINYMMWGNGKSDKISKHFDTVHCTPYDKKKYAEEMADAFKREGKQNDNNLEFVKTITMSIDAKGSKYSHNMIWNPYLNKTKGNEHFYIKNIRINKPITDFVSIKGSIGVNMLMNITNGIYDLLKVYYNDLHSDDSSFQIPFPGTFDGMGLYVNKYHNIRLYIDSHSAIESDTVITYDLYKGSQPRKSDCYDIYSSGECQFINLTQHLNFNGPVMGLKVNVRDYNLIDVIKGIELTFNNKEHSIYLDEETLKEFEKEYGEGIIPFSIKDNSKEEQFEYSINFSAIDKVLIRLIPQDEVVISDKLFTVNYISFNRIDYKSNYSSLIPSMTFSS
jgi:hypothetical protein